MDAFELTLTGERALAETLAPDDERIADVMRRLAHLDNPQIESRCVDETGPTRIWEIVVRASWPTKDDFRAKAAARGAEVVLQAIGYVFTAYEVRPATALSLF